MKNINKKYLLVQTWRRHGHRSLHLHERQHCLIPMLIRSRFFFGSQPLVAFEVPSSFQAQRIAVDTNQPVSSSARQLVSLSACQPRALHRQSCIVASLLSNTIRDEDKRMRDLVVRTHLKKKKKTEISIGQDESFSLGISA